MKFVSLLKFDDNSNKKYKAFRKHPFVTKQRSIFDTIHETTPKSFKLKKSEKSKSKPNDKQSKKRLVETEDLRYCQGAKLRDEALTGVSAG